MKRRDVLKAAIAGGAAAMTGVAAATVPAAMMARGTGDLGVVIERATGSLLIVETTGRSVLARVEGLGDMSHASAVFSCDERYAYVFGRDSGLTQVDMLEARIKNRIIQAGNAIGGAISDDGRLIAVSNYEPGGIRVFDAVTLAMVADIPADCGLAKPSKTVGLTDAPGRQFVYELYDDGQIWIAAFTDPDHSKPKETGLEDAD